MFLVFTEVPVDGAFVEALSEGVHQQCSGNADVEALGKAVHWNLYIHVGMFEGVVGEPCFFGAEDYCYRLIEWQGVEGVIVLMRAGSYNFIAFAVQIVESFGCVELLNVVFVKVEPLAAAHYDVGIDIVNPFVFDDMDVLYAGEIAAPQDGACVVRLINVFKYYCEVACAIIKHFLEALFPLVGDVIREEFI